MTFSPAVTIDPTDPRAPSWKVWESLTPEQRRSVVDRLPAVVPPELFMPEGDPHREAKTDAVQILGRFFRQIGRKVYVSSELNVYYPNEPLFAPDVLAVCDVEPIQRMKWVVADEGRGLDFVLEVHVAGDFNKDKHFNVSRYARLGIPEYFFYDVGRAMLWGYRLPEPKGRTYQPILPQGGRYRSEVLGLELAVREGELRFYRDGALLQRDQDLVVELRSLVDELVKRREQELATEQQQREEVERRLAEEQQKREDAERKQGAAEQLLAEERRQRAELEAELARLRRG